MLTGSGSARVMVDPCQDGEWQKLGKMFFGSEVAPAFKPAIARTDCIVLCTNDCGGVRRPARKAGKGSRIWDARDRELEYRNNQNRKRGRTRATPDPLDGESLTNSTPTVHVRQTCGMRPIHLTIPNSGSVVPPLIHATRSPSDSTGASGSS